MKRSKISVGYLASTEAVTSPEREDMKTDVIRSLTEHRLPTGNAISKEHVTNNQAVRATLLERGIRPEQLPAAEDVRKVERRLSSANKKSLRNPAGLES